MVRGLFGPLKFPYVQFATKDITGDQLYDLFWDVVFHLEMCGFRVVAATADGASPNRAFLRIHFPSKRNSSKNFHFQTLNPFSVEERYIYFFSDPSHLLKSETALLPQRDNFGYVSHLWTNGMYNGMNYSVKERIFHGGISSASTTKTVDPLNSP